MSAGHSETLSKHLTGVLYVGQKNILFCLFFFFFLGHFREDIFLGEIIYLERPCLKPPPLVLRPSHMRKAGLGLERMENRTPKFPIFYKGGLGVLAGRALGSPPLVEMSRGCSEPASIASHDKRGSSIAPNHARQRRKPPPCT
jgi:hypothetical protein